MPNRLVDLSFAVPMIGAMSLHTRRQVAVALRRTDRRHRDGISSDDLVCRYLPDTTLTFVNEAYCRFCRKSAAELVGTKFIELIPEAARPDTLRRVANLITTRERTENEHEVIGPDGNLLWQHWTSEVIVDGAGHVNELQALGRDVTEHHRMAEALTQSNARNEALLRAIPDLMFVQSSDGTYLDYHAPDPSALFVPPDQFLGRKMDDVLPPDLAAMFHREFAGVLASGQPSIVEYPIQLASGVRYFEARIVAFEDRRRLLAIVRDVTDRRLSEDALRQAQADANAAQLSWMGALAASMAHEINQPLAVIEANASAGLQWMNASAQAVKENVRDILVDITSAAHRASAVIQRTLDLFARQPAGRGPVQLRDVVESALATTEMTLRRAGIVVNTDIPAGLPPVHADRAMLHQVMISLLNNATEAMVSAPRRALTVDASVGPDGFVQLGVEDTGPGVDPHDAEAPFRPFHTSKPGHIGIGLSISRAIVEAHGGVLRSVRAQSGARFQMRLPALGAGPGGRRPTAPSS